MNSFVSLSDRVHVFGELTNLNWHIKLEQLDEELHPWVDCRSLTKEWSQDELVRGVEDLADQVQNSQGDLRFGVLDHLIDQSSKLTEGSLENFKQWKAVFLQLELIPATESVQCKQSSMDSLLLSGGQESHNIILHQVWPFLWEVELGNTLNAPDILLLNELVMALIEFLDDLGSEWSLIGLLIEHNKLKTLRGDV